ncbi:M56 family metallopeptidase [Lutispora sp.]|uniref:M56 family metallopeptidase n=1 Tax=Lutispora sp. TaxID=2828727 RepID=UPI00356B5D53
MRELFLIVLNMSLTANYVILFVILARLLLRKAPKVISYALWGAVAFRLIIPFSFESMFSFMPRNTNAVSIPYDIIYQESPQINSGIEVVDSFVNQSLPGSTIGASVNPLQIYIEIGSYIWILGVMVLLIYSLISVFQLKRQLKYAQLIEKNIYEAKNLKTPFVLGLIRPKIYLPFGLNTTERSYILIHEKIHIQRKDHIIKILAFLILSIHWFNPLVWIAFRLMSTDMELSCDERVLREMNEDIKKLYANSLLSLAAGRHIINGSPLAFGEGNVKGRIKNVLNYKKPKFWIVTFSVIIVVVICLGLISNPASKGNSGFVPEDSTKSMKFGPAEELWNSRTKYIGDNSAVGKLISLLPVPEDVQYDHFELHTSEKPYYIEIVYSASSEVLVQYDTEETLKSNTFRKNALILLALVDNANAVRAVLTDGKHEVGFINTREWADYAVGEDVRNYAESPKKLQELIDFSFIDYDDKGNADDNIGNDSLSVEKVVQLVEEINPYHLEPTMSPKERYDLRTKIYGEMPRDKVQNFTYAIESSAAQLAGIVTDNRYVDLVDKDHPRWDAYDKNNLFGVADVLSGIEKYIEYPPLFDDINTAKTLCVEGMEERNILKIIDANRILQDLSRHFIRVPYRGEGEEKVDYGDIHDLYFKATKTLEGAHNLLSD